MDYGDVLAVQKGIVVHGCNAQGVMGSGVAKSVRERFPKAFAEYRRAYESSPSKELEVGTIISVMVEPEKWVVNAITQRYYGRDGRRYVDYDGVRSCFAQIGKLAKETGLPVVYPLIGCDLGGGDWSVVSKIIAEELEGVQHVLYLLPGKTLPSEKPVAVAPAPKAFGRR